MRTRVIVLTLLPLGLFLTLFSHADAAVPQTYTNDNLWSASTTHDRPVSFSVDGEGNTYGVTSTGKTFSQTNVPNEADVRLQKFKIDQAFYYISSYGIILATSDEEAIKLALLEITGT